MGRLHAGVALSAAVHAAAVAWVATYRPDPPPPPAPAPIIELVDVAMPDVRGPGRAAPPVPDVAPLDVALVDPEQPAQVADRVGAATNAPPGRAPTARRPGTTAITGSGAAALGRELPSGSPTPSPLFDMRRGKVDLHLPRDRWDAVEHVPAGTQREQERSTGQLAPAGGGTYRSNQDVFTAKIDRDGGVSLKDTKSFRFRLGIPGPKKLARLIGREIADWYQDDNKSVGTLGPIPGSKPRLNKDAASDQDTRPDHGETGSIFGGIFDISDALMRSKGVDPYASKKLGFLDATRDERVQIGTRYRQRQLAQATQIMQNNLERLWATLADPVERKQGLFELWDEIAETGSDELVTAGRQARLLVIGFIRARLPAGSPGAYTPAELAAFNAKRQSRATFAPYD